MTGCCSRVVRARDYTLTTRKLCDREVVGSYYTVSLSETVIPLVGGQISQLYSPRLRNDPGSRVGR